VRDLVAGGIGMGGRSEGSDYLFCERVHRVLFASLALFLIRWKRLYKARHQ